MRFVPLKTEDQLDLQAIHRVRDRLIFRRTAVINQLPAFLLQRGMVFAKTPDHTYLAKKMMTASIFARPIPQPPLTLSFPWMAHLAGGPRQTCVAATVTCIRLAMPTGTRG
jgi:hypothetical protein